MARYCCLRNDRLGLFAAVQNSTTPTSASGRKRTFPAILPEGPLLDVKRKLKTLERLDSNFRFRPKVGVEGSPIKEG